MVEGQPPRTFSDQQVLQYLATLNIDDRYMIRSPQRHVSPLAIASYQHIHRCDLLLAKACWQERNIANELQSLHIYDIDYSGQFC